MSTCCCCHASSADTAAGLCEFDCCHNACQKLEQLKSNAFSLTSNAFHCIQFNISCVPSHYISTIQSDAEHAAISTAAAIIAELRASPRRNGRPIAISPSSQ